MDDTEKLSQMMIRCGLATGHGDTIDDLIFELEKQIKNTSHAFSDARAMMAMHDNKNPKDPYYSWKTEKPSRDRRKE
jgi:hypothetical protein